jgi:hypothetical protein
MADAAPVQAIKVDDDVSDAWSNRVAFGLYIRLLCG